MTLNYSSGLYVGNRSYTSETLGNAFEVACFNAANSSQNHRFSNENGTITFQYDVYEPLILDLYSTEAIGQNSSPQRISGRPETVFLLIRNITGDGTPTNLTTANCNISLYSKTQIASASGFGDYYTSRYILPATGNLTLEGACASNGEIYTSQQTNLNVEALLIPSGYDLGEVDVFQQPLLLTENGSHSYIAHSGYESGIYPQLQVTQLYPILSNQLNRSYQPLEGQFGFVDLLNLNEIAFIYTGSSTSTQNVFLHASNGFAVGVNITELNGFSRPTLALFDQMNNGLVDALVAGSNSIPTTTLLVNNGSTLQETTSALPDLTFPSICYGDFDNNTRYDLFVSGQNSTEIESGIYIHDGMDYQLNQSLPNQFSRGTCALGRFIHPNRTSLLHFGTNSTSSAFALENWNYIIYNDTRNWSQTTSGLLPGFNGSIYGDAVIADFNGDGLSDIFLCGGTSGNEVLSLYVNDLNVSGEFVQVDPFNQSKALPECSISAADYDFDGDLDLAYTGLGSGQEILLFNNTLAASVSNAAPSPPANISGLWNESTGVLWINWTLGSDAETPATALSYNLEIESLTNGLLLSGQPSVTSKPFQGYLGNMQYRLDYTLYNRTPQNVIVRIQSIDAGLQESSWLEAIVLLGACEPKQFWNITTPSGCTLPATIENNSRIRVQNGSTLTINQATSLGTNTSIHVENGTLILTAPVQGNQSGIYISTDGNSSTTGLELSGVEFIINRSASFIDSRFDSFASNSGVQFVNTSWNILNLTGSMDARFYVDFNFTNQFGEALNNVSIFNDTAFLSNTSRINLTAFRINTSGNESTTHALSFSLPGHYNRSLNITISGNTQVALSLNKNPSPQTGDFTLGNLPVIQGSNYSDDLAALSSIENLSIHRTGLGSIRFTDSVNLSFVNLTEAVFIQALTIFVNDTLAPGLNRSALLQFENLSFQLAPTVLRNGELCTTCSNQSYNGSHSNVSVSSFSNYSLVNNSELSLLTPSVLFNTTDSAFAVAYHSYGNTSSVISGASCSVAIGSNTTLLSFNGINHSGTLRFNTTGTFSANVSCLGNSSYEPLNRNYALNIVRNGAYFLKDSDYAGLVYPSAIFGNLSGFDRFWTTGADSLLSSATQEISIPSGFALDTSSSRGSAQLADFNNDGWNDLFLMGSGVSLTWWNNLTALQTINLSLQNGDAEILDYDSDGDLDIIACGLNASSQPQTVLLENQLADLDYLSGPVFESVLHNLTSVQDCSLDVDKSAQKQWLALAGTNTSDEDIVTIYRIRDGAFSLEQRLPAFSSPQVQLHFGDFTEDGFTDLILSGTLNGLENTSFYLGNGSGFTFSSSLSNQLKDFRRDDTSIISARLSNSSNQSILISGITSTGLEALAYGYNGSHFVEQDLALDVTAVAYGALTLGDIDSDSDLDLLMSGQSTDGPITELYTNTLAEFAGTDSKPLPPSLLGVNYSSGFLTINWTDGSDVETPNTLLSYSLRVGSTTSTDQFHSGVDSQTGNQGNQLSAVLSLPNACFGIQVNTVDSSFQSSNWTALSYDNNQSEVCNGYDNDCDGAVDEDFFYPGTNLFIYNGSINGTAFTCTFYETYAQENLSCPNAPTLSPGSPCQTNAYTGAVYVWNLTSKICDCDLSAATRKNLQIDSSRSGGGGSFAPSQDEPETETTTEPEAVARPPPSTRSDSSPSRTIVRDYFTTTLADFEVRTAVTYENSQTFVSNEIRNTERTLKEDIVFEIDFDSSLAGSLDGLRSLNGFERTDQRVAFSIKNLDYLEEATLLYSLPGIHSLETIEASRFALLSENEYSKAELAQIQTLKASVAEESIVTNLTETVIDNRTVIRVDLDLKENVTEVHGIEIEQEIPKCLIAEITDSILEAAIDPALLQHVEIKEADPLLVWRFDRLEDAVNLELTLDTLRRADCEDEVTLELLAKSFIYQNQPINKLSVILVLVLSVALVGLTLSPVLLATSHQFHRHENPHVLRLAKIMVHQFHKGLRRERVVKDLLHNDENPDDIQAALDHIDAHQPSHTGLTLYEHRVEIALFFAVLILSLMELAGVLPGYLDWFKKVLSWAIMLLVVHHANLARLFFNEDAPRFSITLMLGMFLMHLVHLAEFATEGLSESVGFVFDWYVTIVRLNDAIELSWILFTVGLSILIGCAVYAAFKLPIRERSLGSVFFRESTAQGWAIPLRAVGLSLLFAVFFFSIFNRLIEWLAIAVDSALFVFAVIVLLALTLSMLAHHRGHRVRHFREMLWELLADNYLIALGLALGLLALLHPFFPPWFATWSLSGIILAILLTLVFVVLRLRKLHELSELERIPLALEHLYEKFIRLLRYPRTSVLALAGLPVLQLVVETALTIIPNITGEASHLYDSSDTTLLSLTGNSGLISQQLFLMQAHEAILHALVYLASFLGLIALLLTPVWVWALAFRNRGHGMASGSLSTWLHGHTNWTKRIGNLLLSAGLPLSLFYLVNPLLIIESVSNTGNTGVRFVPQLLEMGTSQVVSELLILLGAITLMAVTLRWVRTRLLVTYASIGVSVVLLSIVYFAPYVQSLLQEVIALFTASASQSLFFSLLTVLLSLLQAMDLILVYLIGGSCFIFLASPLMLKRFLIREFRHWPLIRRITELATNTHLLEYYDEARVRFAGNLVHHLQHYMQQCQKQQIPLSRQIRLIRQHGYPEKLIRRAKASFQTETI